MELTTKYFRTLKGFDFDNINKNTFETLIKSEIFDEQELSDCFKADYFGIETNDDVYLFSDFFLFQEKEYYLKKEIYSEMIYLKNWLLEGFNNSSEITDEIEILVEQEFLLEDKIKVLSENYKKYFNEIKSNKYYPLFKNNRVTSGYESWEEYFIAEIEDNDNFKYVADFLKGEVFFLPESLRNDWNSYFFFSKISNYCEEKRNFISNTNFKEPVKTEIKLDNIDLSFQVLLLEEIINIKNWNDLSDTKKGKIISFLLGKKEETIRKKYNELGKKVDRNSKVMNDRKRAENLVSFILGIPSDIRQ